jgi:hypothetical protein
VAIGCRGTLALGPARRAGLRGLGDERRYAIRRGRTLRVVVDVPAALARAAARRRAVVPARLVSLETGRRGVKTTIRAVGLR